ncbi:PAS domain S-box protein, partial [Candidatus Riflebacteria bacterium]
TIQEQNQLLNSLFNSSTDMAIAATDLDFRITYYNPKAEEFFGYTASEVLGKTVMQMHTRNFVEPSRFERAVGIVRKTGEYRYTVRRSINGEERIVAVRISGISNKKGILQGFVSMSRDVTESRNAEDKLLLLERAVETADNAIVITDVNGIIQWVNPAFSRLTGYQMEEVIGESTNKLKSGTHDDTYYKELWEAVKVGKVWRGEMINKRKDGTLYPEEMTITPVRDAKGRLCSYIAIKQDISQRKSLENSEISIKRLASFPDQNPDPIIQTDLSGKIIYFNPVAGKRFPDLAKLGTAHPLLKDLKLIIVNFKLSGEGNISWIQREIKVDNYIFEVKITFHPESNMIIIFAHDITERKANEAELIKARDEAEAGNRAKDSFLSSMSHEIRTPLNGILGLTQLLLREHSENSRLRDKLRTIYNSGNHLLQLLNDILDIAKIEAGEMNLNESLFELGNFLNEIGEFFRIQAEEKNLSWQIQGIAEDEIIVKGDSGKLRQVIINLVGNALKFTKKGGVTLHLSLMPANYFCFAVSDTGPGITTENSEVIFEAFKQSDSRTFIEGTGLGLAISKKMVEMMSGELSLKSSRGKGSTFTVKIPLSVQSGKERRQSLPGIRRIKGLKKGVHVKALAVDDIASNLEILQEYLEQIGVEVSVTKNGKDALKKIRNKHFDIIFLDIAMPGMSGDEVLLEIRKMPSTK